MNLQGAFPAGSSVTLTLVSIARHIGIEFRELMKPPDAEDDYGDMSVISYLPQQGTFIRICLIVYQNSIFRMISLQFPVL